MVRPMSLIDLKWAFREQRQTSSGNERKPQQDDHHNYSGAGWIIIIIYRCWQDHHNYLQVLAGSGDATTTLWDVESGTVLQTFHGHVSGPHYENYSF